MRNVTLLAMSVFILSACGPRYETNRDAVVAISETFCAHACVTDPATGHPYSESECSGRLASALCNGVSCSANWEGDDQAVDRCLSALTELTCASTVLPPECLDVL